MADYAAKFDALKRRNSERDQRMRDVTLCRTGKADQVFRGLFPDGTWSRPIIANTIDVVAKDFSEQAGVIPTITATGDSALDDSSRKGADKRTKIQNYYVYASGLGTQQLKAADQYCTFGFTVYRIEPNFKDRRPHIHVEPSIGAYWDMDRFGTVKVYAHSYKRNAGDLAALFPEKADLILGKDMFGRADGAQMLEVVRWYDEKTTVMFLPDRSGMVLASDQNRIGRVPVAIALRSSFDGEIRGQFDDVLPVYAAKARLAYLTMMAVQKSVEAPLALPNDVTRLPVGPDAVIRSNSPEKIRRVPLEVPQYAFAENNVLSDELRFGTRYPQARAGQVEGSIVTGQGVKALGAGFDSQVNTSQSALGAALSDAIYIAGMVDEAYFGGRVKEASGTINGMSYRLSYDPARDLKGQYGTKVEYGLMAGLDPNRALVFALQARGDKLMSRGFVRRNLPVSLNAAEEERAIDMEEMRDSLKAGVASLAAAIPQMAMQGQDPTQVIEKIATVINERKKGVPIEDAAAKAFAPTPEPKPAPQDPMAAMAGASAPEPPDAQGGRVENQALPQAPPPMQVLLAGLTGSGKPTMSGHVSRSIPA